MSAVAFLAAASLGVFAAGSLARSGGARPVGLVRNGNGGGCDWRGGCSALARFIVAFESAFARLGVNVVTCESAFARIGRQKRTIVALPECKVEKNFQD